MVNNNNLKNHISIEITKFDINFKYDILCLNCTIIMEGKIMNLKTDKKKENTVEKIEEFKTQRKRNFTKSMESLNKLLDKQNNNKRIN